MTGIDERPGNAVPHDASPLAIICGSGSLPFAVADAAQRQGRPIMLFALLGSADPKRVENYPHTWTGPGQANRFLSVAREHGIRDVVMIGAVTRPAFSQVSRSTQPDLSHSAWRGRHSRRTKRRTVERNISWSSR